METLLEEFNKRLDQTEGQQTPRKINRIHSITKEERKKKKKEVNKA